MNEYGSINNALMAETSIQTFHEQSISVINAMANRSFDGSVARKRAPNENLNKGSMMGAVFILMNAVLGASILVLPYAYGQVGILTALIMELFVTLISYLTHIILADAVDRHGGSNYQDLIGRVSGPKFQMMAQIFLFVYTYGLSCATHITIGDQLEKVCMYMDNATTHVNWYCHRQFLTPVASMIFIFPLIWFRSISSFSYASALSVLSVLYLVAAMVIDYFYNYQLTTDRIWIPDDVTIVPILAYLPVFTLGFQCHMTSVPLYYELHKRSIPRYSVVVFVAQAFVLMFYVICAVAGLSTFGLAVDPDVIRSYLPSDKLMTVSRGAIAVSVISSYPIFIYLGRGAIDDSIVQACRYYNIRVTEASEKRRVATLLIWHFTALTISCITSSLDDVLSFVGSVAALFILFFPGQILWVDSAGNPGFKVTGVLLMGLGFFVFCWTIAYTVYKII